MAAYHPWTVARFCAMIQKLVDANPEIWDCELKIVRDKNGRIQRLRPHRLIPNLANKKLSIMTYIITDEEQQDKQTNSLTA